MTKCIASDVNTGHSRLNKIIEPKKPREFILWRRNPEDSWFVVRGDYDVEQLGPAESMRVREVMLDEEQKGENELFRDQEYHAERMIEFINGDKPAVISFTGGPQRQIAYRIEPLKLKLEQTQKALNIAKTALEYYSTSFKNKSGFFGKSYVADMGKEARSALLEIFEIEGGKK